MKTTRSRDTNGKKIQLLSEKLIILATPMEYIASIKENKPMLFKTVYLKLVNQVWKSRCAKMRIPVANAARANEAMAVMI
ncbi:hypothetical protein Tco_1305443, partial [Tanacetum coccineum]